MTAAHKARYCRCGARLARDNPDTRCSACTAADRNRLVAAPEVPADFWDEVVLQEALASRHMGRVIRAWRTHPHHGRQDFPQDRAAAWVGITQTQLSRIENGQPMMHLDRLIQWARVLRIPADRLWFAMPDSDRPFATGQVSTTSGTPVAASSTVATRGADEAARPAPEDDPAPSPVGGHRQGHPEIDDMNRRELLRLVTMAGASLAVPVDWERMEYVITGTGRLDSETVDEFGALNSHLWQVFALSTSKASTLPLVRSQIAAVVDSLRQSQSLEVRQRLCVLAADLFQLAGEIYFDGNHYTEAAHCYALAATASKEAEAFDLWACALTRHAFISVYERKCEAASPMLELAAGLARRGDGTLSTRYWVAAVQAEAFAGLGRPDLCQRALDLAEEIHNLPGPVHNGGWLRFDGSRLAEERGTCFVALRRPDLAETALTTALAQHLSTRRRGSVLVDLALIGVQRRDVDLLVTHAEAALDLAQQTGSGVIARRLQGLQTQLAPMLGGMRVHRLHQRIATLTGASAA
jgi:hypothetical protein